MNVTTTDVWRRCGVLREGAIGGGGHFFFFLFASRMSESRQAEHEMRAEERDQRAASGRSFMDHDAGKTLFSFFLDN